MSHPIEILQRHAGDIDHALLRITTVRSLLATGQHEMVEAALAELETAMAAADRSGADVAGLLQARGYDDVGDLAEAGPDGALVLRTWSGIRNQARALANSLVATRTQAASVLRHLDSARTDAPVRRRGPHAGRFLVAEG